jgi:hypothetical protein
MARTGSAVRVSHGIDRAHGDGTDPNYPEQHGAFSDRRDVQREGAHAVARDGSGRRPLLGLRARSSG